MGGGTYYKGRVSGSILALGWPRLALYQYLALAQLGLAPFQPQDPATVFPTSRRVRVHIQRRGGPA